MDLNSLTQVLFALVLQFHLQQERRLQMISNLWRNLYLSIFIHVFPSLGLFAGVLISTRLHTLSTTVPAALLPSTPSSKHLFVLMLSHEDSRFTLGGCSGRT